ncbi:MAG: hypothetical protein FJ086_07675 [Deltaproteobacteria bacterium]|nr:hypothetical protein [Deltaproteobacteria bacterium]
MLVRGALRDGNWVPQGALVVQGTAAGPVTFTSAEAVPSAGDWQGLYFSRAVHPSSRVAQAGA